MFNKLMIAIFCLMSKTALSTGAGGGGLPPPVVALEAPDFDQLNTELDLRDLLVIKNQNGTQMMLTDERLNELTFTSIEDVDIKTKVMRVSSFEESTPAEIMLDPSNVVIMLKDLEVEQ